MSRSQRARDYVLELVKRHPGLTAGQLAWVSVGGDPNLTGAADTVPVTYAQTTRSRGIEKRLVELVRLKLVNRGRAKLDDGHGGAGYYAAGYRPPALNEQPSTVPAAPQSRHVGRAHLRDLSALLDNKPDGGLPDA